MVGTGTFTEEQLRGGRTCLLPIEGTLCKCRLVGIGML